MINLEKLNRKSVTPPTPLYRRRAPAPHWGTRSETIRKQFGTVWIHHHTIFWIS